MAFFDAFQFLTERLARSTGVRRQTTHRRAGQKQPLAVETLELRLALSAAPLVITEIMYHPAAPTAAETAAGYTDREAFEFLELQNISQQDLALQGFAFTNGIAFTFPAMNLAPGAYVVVVKDTAAFTARYGTAGILIAGQYGDNSNLANSGEQLTLKGAGQTLLDFSYKDGWYPATDGQGASLMIVDPHAATDTWGNKQSWLPSAENGGSPGKANYFPDLTAPSVPQNARLTGVNGFQVSLAWDPSTDAESGISEYRLYRDGTLISHSATPMLTDTALQPTLTYRYQISAVNGDGTESAKGSVLSVFVPPVDTTPHFADGVSQGTVSDNHITEASGLAASRRNAKVIWTHNDGSGAATLYALNTKGDYLGAFALTGIQATDCEDIAIGPGPVAGVDYLYLGDIGDNVSDRTSIEVYRVAEPTIRSDGGNQSQAVAGADAITLHYPDGAHNAETLLADPWTGDLYVITKELAPNRVYRVAAADLVAGHTVTLSLVGSIDFPLANGGDISPNGQEILLRREDFAQIFARAPGQSVMAALAGTPRQVPVVGPPTEPNGEAIAFDSDGSGYFTLSEGTGQPLYYFQRTSISPGITRTWIGGAGTDWTTPGNWLNGAAPQPGDTLVFSGTATTTVNNFPAGTYFHQIIFQGGNVSVSGSPIASAAGGSMIVDVESGGTCSLNIPLLGAGGIRFEGGGTLVLQATGNYPAGTVVNTGTLVVARADALPPGGSLTMENGGKVVLDSGLNSAIKVSGLRLSLPRPTAPARAVTATPTSSAPVIPVNTGVLTATVTAAAANQTPVDLGILGTNGGTVTTATIVSPQPISAKAKSVPAVKTRPVTTPARKKIMWPVGRIANPSYEHGDEHSDLSCWGNKTLHALPNAAQAAAREYVLTNRAGKWLPSRLSWIPFIEETSVRKAAPIKHDIFAVAVDEVLAKD